MEVVLAATIPLQSKGKRECRVNLTDKTELTKEYEYISDYDTSIPPMCSIYLPPNTPVPHGDIPPNISFAEVRQRPQPTRPGPP